MEQRRGEAELARPLEDPNMQADAGDLRDSVSAEDGGDNLWDCAPGAPEEWLKSWDGRQKTHDMFKHSYE